MTAPVIVIVSVADVDVMSNEYVAAGQAVPLVPQFESVSVPIVSAFAAPAKMKQKASVTTPLINSFFKIPPSLHLYGTPCRFGSGQSSCQKQEPRATVSGFHHIDNKEFIQEIRMLAWLLKPMYANVYHNFAAICRIPER